MRGWCRACFATDGVPTHRAGRWRCLDCGEPLRAITDGGPWQWFEGAPDYPEPRPDDLGGKPPASRRRRRR